MQYSDSDFTCVCLLAIHVYGDFQKTKLFQRAVMFSMLNLQPNGAGFVGFYNEDAWNLSPYSGVELRVRGQGDNSIYKLNMRHNGQGTHDVAYEAFYEVCKFIITVNFNRIKVMILKTTEEYSQDCKSMELEQSKDSVRSV